MTRPIVVLMATIAIGAIIPLASVRAESTLSTTQKDKVIADLKSEIKLLEQRVESLEHQDQRVDQRVRIIDRKLEVQQEADLAKAKDLPVIKAEPPGVFLSSADSDDWQVPLSGVMQD